MRLKTLSLEQFRSHESESWEFSPGITLLVGENGIGKTNILEAISALAFTRPFRSREKGVFISHTKEYAKISGSITGKHEETLDIFWESASGKKTVFRHNGVTFSPSEYLQKKSFQAVLFSPEEMNLPFSAPKVRRTFLSSVLAPVFPDYFEAALKYESVLRHRNRLLSEYGEGRAKKEEFDFWNTELEKWAKVILARRREFFHFTNGVLSALYGEISGKNAVIEIRSEETISPELNFQEALAKSFAKDVAMGATSLGPHRDDFSFFLDGNLISEAGSRGEVRSALLALTFAEQAFLEQHTGLAPLLLLDDVLSELDEHRQENLLARLTGFQAIITTTQVPSFLKKSSAVQVVRIGKKK